MGQQDDDQISEDALMKTAKRLIEFVQRGMDAQAAVDKVLVEALDPWSYGKKAAKEILKKLNLEPRLGGSGGRYFSSTEASAVARLIKQYASKFSDDADQEDFDAAVWDAMDDLGWAKK